jgi:chromosome segregation ATPase
MTDPKSEADDVRVFSQDALQEDFERGVRAVEMRVRHLISDFDAERVSLVERLKEEQNRVRERDIQLAAARQDAERLRGHIASVTARMARHEKDVDALEDEIDLMITRVESRALGALKETEARTKQVLEAKANVERELAEQQKIAARALEALNEIKAQTKEVLEAKAESERELARQFRMQLREQEEIAAGTQRAMIETHHAEVAALTADIERLTSELQAIKGSLSWRLAGPFRRRSD